MQEQADREKVIRGLNDIHGVAAGVGTDQCYLNRIGIKQLQTLIDEATELLKAGEEVVHCRECRHGVPLQDRESWHCKEWDTEFYAPHYSMDRYFCADGKKKDNDENQ